MGDPAGIGTEVVLKALYNFPERSAVTVVGDRRLMEAHYMLLRRQGVSAILDPGAVAILDLDTGIAPNLGLCDRASGAASFAYLERAITETLAGTFGAIATGPIHKAAWQQAGHDFAGQTEVLASRCGVTDYGMLFVAQSPHTDWILRTLLATVHLPLGAVPAALTPELIWQKLTLLQRSLEQDFGVQSGTIAVAGINPHSGEQGYLGDEEVRWLEPLLRRWDRLHPTMTTLGPVPPDTLWLAPARAWREDPKAGHSAYLAMYHDQGLIPVKVLAFERAVNTTIGLPFVRTSPDHGTAAAIAGKGIADPTSMAAALTWALTLAQQRLEYSRST